MRDSMVLFAQGTNASTYFRLGWCPGFVKVINFVDGDEVLWCPLIPEEYSVNIAGSTGNRSLGTSAGIRLVKFNDEPGSLPGSGGTPSDLENGHWWKANGIEVAATAIAIGNGEPFCVEAYRMTVPIIRAVHDGTTDSDTYFEDSSIDFLEAGVSPNGKFILINESNDNYAYVGAITKPAGQANHCRIYTYEDEGLVTANDGANFDTDDVIYIIPREWVQYPLSGIGLMT